MWISGVVTSAQKSRERNGLQKERGKYNLPQIKAPAVKMQKRRF